MVTAMSPFPDGSSMVNTWPTNAGPAPPPALLPRPAAAAPAIRAPGSGCGPRRDSEEAEAEPEETGRRSGTARWGAAGEGEGEAEAGGDGDEEEKKGKAEAREWKGLDDEEERGMVVGGPLDRTVGTGWPLARVGRAFLLGWVGIWALEGPGCVRVHEHDGRTGHAGSAPQRTLIRFHPSHYHCPMRVQGFACV